MTEFRLDKQRDCIDEYVRMCIFGQNKTNRITLIALAVCLVLLAVFGIAAAIITGKWVMLLISALAVIMGAAYPLITGVLLRSISKKADSAPEISDITAAVSDNDILFIKNGIPIGGFSWEKIAEINEGKTGFFLLTEDGSLLILAKSAVISGTYDEAAQVLRVKAGAAKK